MKGHNKKKRPKIYIAFFAFSVVVVLFLFLRNIKKNDNVTYPDYPERFGLKVKAHGPSYNLLLITVDTLREDYLGSNGYDLETSPSVDQLIRRGLYFSHAITPIPRTTQALASLLTGCYPHKTEVRRLWDRLSLKPITLATVLKRLGYQTIAVVSNHTLPPRRGLDRGFDIYDYGKDTRDAVETTRAAVKHLKKLHSETPFFLWVHYIDPHVPYYPPEEIALQFDPGYEGRYRTHFGQKPGGVGRYAYPEDIGKERAVYHNDLGDDVNRHIRRLYAADIKLTDIGIEQLLQDVHNRVNDNLITIFTADHGESLGEHDYYYEHGAYVYNAELRIPLAFVLPENHSKHFVGRVNDWVSLVDVFPTILDLMDVELLSGHGNEIDGRSLFPYWDNKTLEAQPLFAESGHIFFPDSVKRRVKFDVDGRFRSVFLKEWKLIWTPYQKDDLLYEIYNIELDPYEAEDLYSPDHPKSEMLKEYLHEWMSQQKQRVWGARPSKKDLEILKSLGYIK